MDCSGDKPVTDKMAAVAGETSLHNYTGAANDVSNWISESEDTECATALGMDKNRMTLRIPQIYPVFNFKVLNGLDNRGRYIKSSRLHSIQPFFQKGPVFAQLFPRSHEFFKYPSRPVFRYLSVDFKQQRLVTLNELRCCVRLEYHFLRGLTFALSGAPREMRAKDAPFFGASALERAVRCAAHNNAKPPSMVIPPMKRESAK